MQYVHSASLPVDSSKKVVSVTLEKCGGNLTNYYSSVNGVTNSSNSNNISYIPVTVAGVGSE